MTANVYVLTLDEAMELKPNTDIWIEEFENERINAHTVHDVDEDFLETEFLFRWEHYLSKSPAGFRVWTARPTKEQREAVKW